MRMTGKAAYKCADVGKVHEVVNLHRGQGCRVLYI